MNGYQLPGSLGGEFWKAFETVHENDRYDPMVRELFVERKHFEAQQAAQNAIEPEIVLVKGLAKELVSQNVTEHARAGVRQFALPEDRL